MSAKKTNAMSPKSTFCASLAWRIKINWFDLTGMHALDDARVVKIQLSDPRTVGIFVGFSVEIINKVTGKIDSKLFRFDDYLSADMASRSDTRRDYPVAGNSCYHVDINGYRKECDWYIAKPKSTKPFCEAVESYIASFKTGGAK